MVGGRPRKTAEELDAEMEDYWGGGNEQKGDGADAAAAGGVMSTADDEMID
jgi:THO complex subunit 4